MRNSTPKTRAAFWSELTKDPFRSRNGDRESLRVSANDSNEKGKLERRAHAARIRVVPHDDSLNQADLA
jgi:hypothetical protein